MSGKKTLTRSDLAKSLQSDLGAASEGYRFVNAFFDTLRGQIAENDEVKIHGFGVFRCLKKPARVGRNLKTGAAVKIKARRVVSFVAGGRLKSIMRDDEK